MRETQIAVIGGGPAGLQAALSVGRVCREAVLFDSATYRNAAVQHMHNVAGFDGADPGEFRRRVRAELDNYASVSVRNDVVTSVESGADAFIVRSVGGDVRARAVILATGMRDDTTVLPGLSDVWGTLAGQCPFCQAFEFKDKRLAIVGGWTAPHYLAMLAPITSQLVVLTNGEEYDAAAIEPYGVETITGRIVAVARDGDELRVSAEGAADTVVAGLFTVPPLVQRSDLPAALGLDLQPSGAVRVDPFMHTSVPGIYAAGDMAHLDEFPAGPASVVQSLAMGQLAATSAVKERC